MQRRRDDGARVLDTCEIHVGIVVPGARNHASGSYGHNIVLCFRQLQESACGDEEGSRTVVYVEMHRHAALVSGFSIYRGNARSASSTAPGASAITLWPHSARVTTRLSTSASMSSLAFAGGAMRSRCPRINSAGQRTFPAALTPSS